MNTQLQTFQFQSHPLTVITDEHGEPWFIAKEVVEILDYSDTYKMTSKLDDDEVQNRQIGGFGNRGVNIINESGLWSSVLRSTKPEAKAVKKWLTAEVLPAIRKTGGYNTPAPTGPLTLAQFNAARQTLVAEQKRLNSAQVIVSAADLLELARLQDMKAKKHQIRTGKQRIWTPEEDAIALEMVENGFTHTDIAQRLDNRTAKAVGNHLLYLAKKQGGAQ